MPLKMKRQVEEEEFKSVIDVGQPIFTMKMRETFQLEELVQILDEAIEIVDIICIDRGEHQRKHNGSSNRCTSN